MLFGCSKVRLDLRWSYANKFSLVDMACHTTSLYLCWKTFLKTRFLSKSLGKGETPFNWSKITMVNHTWPFPNSSTVPSRQSEPLSCPGHTLQVLCQAQLHFSENILWNQNLTLGNVVIFTTVHDRGLGYSNRFTLCRGCTLYPQDSINPPGYHHRPSYASMQGSDNRTEPTIYPP
jgi:hypothetical protein